MRSDQGNRAAETTS